MKNNEYSWKERNGLRLWNLWVAGCVLGASGGNAARVPRRSLGEPQARNFLNEIGSDLVTAERLCVTETGECLHINNLTR